jgi:transcriptional regulator with XRE-family HTH domain
METEMTGEKVKSLREARCWSQAHLAQAACVNIRTIQRIEAGEACSHETMLAIAGALDVGVGALGAAQHALAAGPAALPRWLDPRRAAFFGAIATMPCIVFVGVNAFREWLGISVPYETLASIVGRIVPPELFNLLSPLLFVGGAFAAVLLCAFSQIRPRVSRAGRLLSLEAIDVRPDVAAMAVLVLALIAGGGLFLYAAAEQIGTIAAR